MKAAIIICFVLAALLAGYTFRVASAGTSDGDYTFIFPAAGALLFLIVAGVLAAIKFL